MRPVPVPLAGPVDPESGPRSRAAALDPVGFVQDLDRELLRALARAGEQARATVQPAAGVVELLAGALREAIETAEVAATWLTDEPDLALRLGLARQVGDEARHFEAVGDRIRELGADPGGEVRTRAHSALFRYLRGLQTPAERLAAGLAREAFSRLRSGLIAEVAESQGDGATAALFRDGLGPDEVRHIDFCRRELPRYALTGEDQEAARRAVARTLQLAEEAADPSRPAKAAPAPPAEPPQNSR
ncbi:MAG TPA: ferritin-like domain-containing protein [Anaeromyxobacteraceae bacterium]|nr:ferritin-like domain-containing protein [Anaeromyxobacteraceae bacterium]